MRSCKELADAIMKFLKDNDIALDVSIYVDNKRYSFTYYDFDKKEFFPDPFWKEEEGEFFPGTYFSYFAKQHILSMSFEGDFYRIMNVAYENDEWKDLYNKFRQLLDNMGVWYELGDAWNLTVFPLNNNYDEWDYTDYRKGVDLL